MTEETLHPQILLSKVRWDVEKTLEKPPGLMEREQGGCWPRAIYPFFLLDRCVEWHVLLAFMGSERSLADSAGNLML